MVSNPELAQLFIRWRQLKEEIGNSLSKALPNREDLVLYVLSMHDSDALTAEEKIRIDREAEKIRLALDRHPALADVLKDIETSRTDFLQTWNRHFQTTDSSPSAHIFNLFQTKNSWTLRIAATFLVLTLASAVTFLVWRTQNVEIVKTKAGEFRIIELVDGSSVRLSEKSKLRYRKTAFDGDLDRSIFLNGRAFFDIAPHSNPFTVETPTALTKAIGTRFSIDAGRSVTEVVLTHGQVTVDSRQRNGHLMTLSPGQYSRIARRKPPTEPESVENLTEKLSWTGLSVFRNTPLREVVVHFSEHYDLPLSVSATLAPEPFNGSFDPDTLSVDELLETLSIAFDASYEDLGDQGFVLR